MIIGWLLIIVGILFAISGIGETARIRTRGRGDFVFALAGAAGILLIVVGAILV
jgi:hypothetical protein